MIQTINIIVWWIGALVVLFGLFLITLGFLYSIKIYLERITKNLLMIAKISTVRYWVQRMEKEGLTVCRKEYRRMAAEKLPRTIEEFQELDNMDTKGSSQ